MKKRFLALFLCLALALPISGLALATGGQTTPAETTTVAGEKAAAAGETTTVPAETTTMPSETTVASGETTTAVPETTTAVPETTTGAGETTTVPATPAGEAPEAPDGVDYNALPVEELAAALDALSSEEFMLAMDSLTEEKAQALFEYQAAQQEDDEVGGAAENFTNAAPLMKKATSVVRKAARLMTAAADTTAKTEGLELNKDVTVNQDGTYTINLEAYTTGTVTGGTAKPSDIVLVLDVSGSMKENFNNTTYTYHAVKGTSYTYTVREWVWVEDDSFWGGHYEEQRVNKTGYGMNAGNTTYYIANSSGGYDAVSYRGRDDNGYEYYSTGQGGNRSYYYPLLEETAEANANRANDYPVTQLYTRSTSGSTSTNKMEALKAAAKAFIASTEKQNEGITDPAQQNRISIVKFAGTKSNTVGNTTYQDGRYTYNHTQVVKPMTAVNAATSTQLQNAVNGLSAAGATAVDWGLEHAQSQLANTSSDRNKVVIVFTDGEPNHGSGFSDSVANSALSTAKTLKDGGTTVYTVCIAKDAAVNAGGALPANSGDANKLNRFMHLLSSNYPGASGMNSIGTGGSTGILQEDGTYASYYLTTNNGDSLEEIFKKISDQIATPTLDLGTDTQIKDIVTPYFTMPADASEVTVQSVACTGFADGTPQWAATATSLSDAVTIQGTTISVTGFDFAKNFVNATPRQEVAGQGEKDFYGRKLVITFTISPKPGFLGGNNVPTNGTASGVYDKDGKLIGSFDVPHVNVPVVKPSLAVTDKTIYLGGEAVTVDELYTPFTVAEDWMDDFVTISYTKPATIDQTDCGDYDYRVTLTPEPAEQSSKGTPATAQTSDPATAHVHVLKPLVTAAVNDVVKYFGETYTLGEGAGGTVEAAWTDSHTGHTPGTPSGTAPYGADDLELAYAAEGFTNGGALGKQDMDVTVSVVKKADKAPVDAVITTTCAADAGCTTPDTDGKYTVHIKTCQLTLTKTGGKEGDSYVFKIKRNGGDYMTVQVTGNTPKTVYELPVGAYTVEEEAAWSWRYDGVADKTATLSAAEAAGEITCANTPNNLIYWLNGYSAARVNNPNAVADAK